METEESKPEAEKLNSSDAIEDQIAKIKITLKEIKNLSTIIKQAEVLKTKFDKEKNTEKFKVEDYIISTKEIVTSLISSVDQLSNSVNENFNNPSKESEPQDVKPQIGSIKVVDLNKLLDPNRNNKPLKNVKDEEVVVILSDSSESDRPMTRRTRNKTSQRRKSSTNNNKENLSDEDRVKNTSKSILKTKRTSDKSHKKVQFSDKDVDILSKMHNFDISSESSDDSDDSYRAPKSLKIKIKKKSKEVQKKKDFGDDKVYHKCYVKVTRIPAEKLKDVYKKMKAAEEDKEIDRLCNLKSLKRRRNDGSDVSVDSDTTEKQVKKKKRKNGPRPKCRQVPVSSDSESMDINMPLDKSVDDSILSKDDIPASNNDLGENFGSTLLDTIGDDKIEKDVESDGSSSDNENKAKKQKGDSSDKLEPNKDKDDKPEANKDENEKDEEEKSSKVDESGDAVEESEKIEDKSESPEKNTDEEKKDDSTNDLNEDKSMDEDKEGSKDLDGEKGDEEKENKNSEDKEKSKSDDSSEDEDSKKKKDEKSEETEEEENVSPEKNNTKENKNSGDEEKSKSDDSSEDEDSKKKKKKDEKAEETEEEENVSPEKNKTKENKNSGDKEKTKSDDSSEDEDSKKKKKKDEKAEETEEEEENVSPQKNKTKEKNSKHSSDESDKSDGKPDKDSSDDSDSNNKAKSSSSWRKDKLLTAKLSDTDSEKELEKFKKKKAALKEKQNESNDSDDEAPMARKKDKRLTKKRAKRVLSDSESEKSDSDKKESSDDSQEEKSSSSDSEEKNKTAKKTSRRRIKRVNDSSDDDDKTTRKHIRKVIARDSLAESTKQAEKDEAARKARILEKQKKYNSIFEADKLESTTLTKVVLDFNDETEEELLKVDKDLVKHLKPHQGKGVQFMWDTCFESIERAKTTVGSGCILAHCMGLGKTLQVITLIHTLLTNKEKCGVKKVLVVCPLSTVLNWVAEFKKWIDEEDDSFEVFDLVAFKDNRQRVYQTTEWHKHGGVLVLGYDMFRNLSNDQNKRLTKKVRAEFSRALIDPGPDLVVCDEGHLLKNEKTSISKSMNKLKTQRRIVLTGTPLQNNLKEYWCMVQFVKPNLLGTYKEYLNRFVNPITNGQYTDSTQHDIHIMRKRSHVLHKLLDGIVQRRDYSVLAPFLPPKNEYVLFISLTSVQLQLYSHYLREFARKQSTKRGKSFLFTDFQEFQRICTHPRVLLDKSIQVKLQKEKEDFENDDESEGSLKDFIDDGEDSEANSKTTSESESGNGSDNSAKSDKKKYTRRTRALAGKEPEIPVEEIVEGPSEWWRQYMLNDELDNIKYSGKLHLLFEILHQCELMGDKVLVFSQSLYSLNVIEYFLAKIDEASQNNDTSTVGGYMGSWSLGLDYFRLDGSSSCDNRANWCKVFNDPENTRARLFLISTRAGGLGINLVAANRVIIFDVSWNPSHDIQSIYRVYRFGQTKPSYVYRFVTLGTMEMKVYERQVTKQAISKRVIDEQQIDRHYNQNDLAELYKFEPKDGEERPIPLVPKDVLLGELLQNFKNLIFSYHEHQSLLENKEDEVLDEEERKAAWEEFENEKTARVNTFNNPGAINGIPLQTIAFALNSIIQREHPLFTQKEIDGVMPQLVAELRSQMALGDMTLYQKILIELRQQQNKQQQQKIQEFYRMQMMQGMKNFPGMSPLVGNPFYQDPQQQMWMQQQQAKQNGQNGASSSGASRRMDPNEVVQIDD